MAEVTLSGARSPDLCLCTSVWENLPQCLLEHIFLRLPLVSLSKFRAVSRSWNELLHSENFLKRHEVVRPVEDPWILSIFTREETNVVEAYDRSCTLWRRINHASCQNFPWTIPMFADGGLLCTHSAILNPLTYSTRHISCPVPKMQCEISALQVDRLSDSCRVFFLAKDQPSASVPLQGYNFLMIYDSKTDSWRRTQNSPVSFRVEVGGLIFNNCAYFIVYPSSGGGREATTELKLMYCNLATEEWGTRAFPSHIRGLPWIPRLHQWQNHVYCVSIRTGEPTLYVDEIKIEAGEWRTVEALFRNDFDMLLGGTFSTSRLDCVCTSDNLIIVSVRGHWSSSNVSRVAAVYDLHSRKWNPLENGIHSVGRLVGFKPTLSVEINGWI